MGKKGKQKARVETEDEDEDDGMPGLGGLFEDEGGGYGGGGGGGGGVYGGGYGGGYGNHVNEVGGYGGGGHDAGNWPIAQPNQQNGGVWGTGQDDMWNIKPTDSVSNANAWPAVGHHKHNVHAQNGPHTSPQVAQLDRRDFRASLAQAMGARGQQAQNLVQQRGNQIQQALHNVHAQVAAGHQQNNPKGRDRDRGRGRQNSKSKKRTANEDWGGVPAWGAEEPGDDGGWPAGNDQGWANENNGWTGQPGNAWEAPADNTWGQHAENTLPNFENKQNFGGENDWGVHHQYTPALSHAPAMGLTPTISQSQSWGGWGPINNAAYPVNAQGGRMPKVMITPPSAVQEKMAPTPKQNNQLISSLMNRLKGGRPASPTGKRKKQHQENRKRKNSKKNKGTPAASPWPVEQFLDEDEEEEEEEEEYEDDYNRDREYNRDMIFSGATAWDDPTYTMPSKAYAVASEGGHPVSLYGAIHSPYLDTSFLDSQGMALTSAQKALYGSERLARHRIHWDFSPDKDERVRSLLVWIQSISQYLASYGFNKFIQGRERGALITNADYRPPSHPTEPAFDWITYDQAQKSKDRILQESIAFYDPSIQVLVFVFLLSKSGNSMAIWRRKLALPNNVRLAHSAQLHQTTAALKKAYPIYLDEMPTENPIPAPEKPPTESQQKRLTKRKWFKWGR